MSEVTDADLWGIDGSIVLYGIFSDIALLIPLIMYLVLDDTSSWAQYHQTYINMIFSSYAPLGISWFIVLADDSNAARTSLRGAIEMAGLGPFALLWVGWATFCMSAKSAGVLLSTNLGLYIWAILYPVINIGLIIMHYHVSPPMYAWLDEAPMKANPIDSVRPWSEPTEQVAAPAAAEPAAAPVAEEPAAEEPAAEEPAAEEAEETEEEGDDFADETGEEEEDEFAL